MSVHYNAFISYRHAEVDSRVASEVQHRLEHFHVPAAIRKKTGMGKIERIFRDKEELPITSDLNDNITQALENADYLIVICSPRTRESTWVQREIEAFLKTHTRKQVLTVLAEGEPPEIIPEILLYDEQTDPATGETRRVAVEPLSCDYRGKFRTARQEELPRLASALLGCGYDELRQRQRQYQMRRTVGVLGLCLAASLAFGAYFVRTSVTIRESYRQLEETHAMLEDTNAQLEDTNAQLEASLDQSLRNQSEYLAAESRKALEAGDRLLAIRLALGALPSGAQDRPVIPQAELAMVEALGAYQSDEEIAAVGTFTLEGTVSDYLLDSEGDRLIALDNLGQVTVWDTASYHRLAAFRPSLSDKPNAVKLAQDRYLLINYPVNTYCYDLEDNSLLWVNAIGGSASDLMLAEGEEQLLYVNSETGDFSLIDVRTGDILQTIPLALTPEQQEQDPVFRLGFPDHDGQVGSRFVAWCRYYESWDNAYYVPVVIDLEQGSAVMLARRFGWLDDLCLQSDGGILLFGGEEARDEISEDWFGYGYSFLRENPFTVYSLSPEGEEHWHTDGTFFLTTYFDRVLPCGEWGVVCVGGNVCLRLDGETGEILSRAETDTAIVRAYWNEGDDSLTVITRSGKMGFFDFEAGGCSLSDTFVDNLVEAKVIHGAYVCQYSSDTILRYRLVADENFAPFADAQSLDNIYQYAYLGEKTLTIQSYEDVLFVFDLEERRQTCTIDLNEWTEMATSLGLSEDGKIYCYDRWANDLELYAISPEDCSVETVAMPLPEGYHWYGEGWLWQGKVYRAARLLEDYDDRALVSCDVATGEVETIPLDLSVSAGFSACVSCGGQRFLLNGDGIPFLFDPATGGSVELEGLIQDDTISAWSGDGALLAYCDGSGVALCGGDGTRRGEIDVISGQVKGMSFTPDGETLLILGSDGVLYLFDLDGNPLGETALFGTRGYRDPMWEFLPDRLMLLWGSFLCWIDLDSWELAGYAGNSLGYDAGLILSYQYESGTYTFGCYTPYSVEEMVKMGEAALANAALNEHQLAQYGLD